METPIADHTYEWFEAEMLVVVLFIVDDVGESLAAGVAFVGEFLQMHTIDVG